MGKIQWPRRLLNKGSGSNADTADRPLRRWTEQNHISLLLRAAVGTAVTHIWLIRWYGFVTHQRVSRDLNEKPHWRRGDPESKGQQGTLPLLKALSFNTIQTWLTLFVLAEYATKTQNCVHEFESGRVTLSEGPAIIIKIRLLQWPPTMVKCCATKWKAT